MRLMMNRSLPLVTIFYAVVVGWFQFITPFVSYGQDSDGSSSARKANIENVVLITLDGLRSEEVFTGADKRLISKDCGVKNVEACTTQFWREESIDRRRVLMPSLWDTVENRGGWIAGNPDTQSVVQVTNGLFFSYPGYNELLSGFPDPWVNTNDKRYNKNTTVLEWIHNQEGFHNRVSAYGSWDVFPFIINDRRSGIPVNAGWMPLTVGSPEKIEAANFIASQLFHEFEGVRYDSFTTLGAVEELKSRKPRVLFVSLGETDDWAHAGRYDLYLLTAQQNDRFIKELWETTQSIDQYRNKTLFLLTTDHGRGDGREGWKNHSILLKGSERIWIAAWGVPLQQTGIDTEGRYTQSQIAPSVASALGFDFQAFNDKIVDPLPILPRVSSQPEGR